MTAAALRHTKCLSRLLLCDRREEHAGTSGLSRVDKRLAKNKQSAVIYQLDLKRRRQNHQSRAGFFHGAAGREGSSCSVCGASASAKVR